MPNSIRMPVFWHPKMLEHRPPDGVFKFPDVEFLARTEPHPERPERAENILGVLEHFFEDSAPIESARQASRSELSSVHTESHIEWVEAFAEGGGGRFDGTTTGGNEHTFEAARYASGAAIEAARRALETPSDVIPYALVRPPGHHAQSDTADGFCFFNNTAVAAQTLIETTDVESIAIVDWDVHHGNGTQEIFYDRDDVLPISIHHEHGSWHETYHPQTGELAEHGEGDGEGYTVNVPIPAAVGNDGYAEIFESIVEPILAEYRPDALLVSAGQDSGIADPNGRNMVDRDGFRWMASAVRRYGNDYADSNLAVIQEGGYQQSHLAFATLGVFEGLLDTDVDLSEHGVDGDPFAWLEESREPLESRLDDVRDHYGAHWSL